MSGFTFFVCWKTKQMCPFLYFTTLHDLISTLFLQEDLSCTSVDDAETEHEKSFTKQKPYTQISVEKKQTHPSASKRDCTEVKAILFYFQQR